jgi:nitroreductase
MDFFEVVNTRASCRAFAPCTVKGEDITQILDTARRAPTAFTVQPWHFIVIRNPESITKLGEVQDCNAQASAAIVAVGDPAMSDFWKEDLSAAIENMHMACTALGYASLWVAVLPEKEAIVRSVTGIPDELQPLAILPIGAAQEPVIQAERKPLSSMAHDETFGQPWA